MHPGKNKRPWLKAFQEQTPVTAPPHFSTQLCCPVWLLGQTGAQDVSDGDLSPVPDDVWSVTETRCGFTK